MANKPKQVVLTGDQVTADLEELKKLDESMQAVIGTAAEMQKKAAEAVEGTIEIAVPVEVAGTFANFVRMISTDAEVKVTGEIIDLLDMATSLLRDNLSQSRQEAITGWLKDNAKDTGPGLEALSKKRADLAETIIARAKLLVQAGILDAVPDIPNAPKSKASRSASGSSVKVSGARYYKVEGGEKNYIGDTQNSVSSVAFYWTKKLTGEKLSTDDFVAWAKKHHNVDVKQASPWSITANGITVGMDVVAADADKADAPA